MKSLIPMEIIEQKIFLIRGQKVMLDWDLAQLYGVETRVLNQAVRRNIDRFPADFMFSLTRDEIMRISQFVISSTQIRNETLKFAKSVLAFTEQGVAMLSTVLNSKRAIEVNILIMRAFVKLREMIASNKELAKYNWFFLKLSHRFYMKTVAFLFWFEQKIYVILNKNKYLAIIIIYAQRC